MRPTAGASSAVLLVIAYTYTSLANVIGDKKAVACDTVACPEFYIPSGVLAPLCVPDPKLCENVTCGPVEKCHLEVVQCFTTPCPPIASCQFDNCSVVRCAGGHKCVDGACIPDSCDGFYCPSGEECFLQQPKCPGGKAVPACRAFDKCLVTLCETGTKCINGQCYKEPTCQGFHCPKGQKCYLQQVQCFTTPCFPIPSCKNQSSPSSNVKCP